VHLGSAVYVFLQRPGSGKKWEGPCPRVEKGHPLGLWEKGPGPVAKPERISQVSPHPHWKSQMALDLRV
jgi:hypothetical protein